MKKSTYGSVFFLQLSLALLFVAMGVLGLMNFSSGSSEFMRNANKLLGRSNDLVPIIMAIVQLLAGCLLFLSCFIKVSNGLLNVLLLIIFVFQIASVIMSYFMSGFLEPSFIKWLASLSPQLVVVSALWVVFRLGR